MIKVFVETRWPLTRFDQILLGFYELWADFQRAVAAFLFLSIVETAPAHDADLVPESADRLLPDAAAGLLQRPVPLAARPPPALHPPALRRHRPRCVAWLSNLT